MTMLLIMTFMHDVKLGGVTVMAHGRKHSIRGWQSRSGGQHNQERWGRIQARTNRKFLWAEYPNIEIYVVYTYAQESRQEQRESFPLIYPLRSRSLQELYLRKHQGSSVKEYLAAMVLFCWIESFFISVIVLEAEICILPLLLNL